MVTGALFGWAFNPGTRALTPPDHIAERWTGPPPRPSRWRRWMTRMAVETADVSSDVGRRQVVRTVWMEMTSSPW
jgi:hypothetical protein